MAPPAERLAERASRLCFVAGFWGPLLICTWLALTPSPPDSLSSVSDVVLHAFAFSYLTFALALAHPGPHAAGAAARALYPGVWMLVYGVALEVVQALGGERRAELKDLLVDLAGVAFGLLLVRALGGWTRRTLMRSLSWLMPSRV